MASYYRAVRFFASRFEILTMSAPVPSVEWYCQVAGKTHGPYSTQDLKRLGRDGRLLPAAYLAGKDR